MKIEDILSQIDYLYEKYNVDKSFYISMNKEQKIKGMKGILAELDLKKNSEYEKKDIVAITIMRCMLLPYAQDNNIPFEEALLRFCESETYEALFDFSSEMNSAPPGEVIANPETVLYAFTNAIIDSCPEDKLTGVRFRIEGSSDTRFRDQVNLDQVFTRNADVIYNPVVKLEESEGE